MLLIILSYVKKNIEERNLNISNFSLLVMDSSAASVALSTRSRPGTPLMDETMEAQPDSQTCTPCTSVNHDKLKCEFIDDTFFEKNGVVVQFINGNCAGSTSLIGGMRLSISDIKKVPAYLSKNKTQLKKHAIRCLESHFQNMQCCIGATEKLEVDDYGMSLSVASLTHTGSTLNPSKRHEGPLFFCLFTNLVEPTMLTHSDWDLNVESDSAYVINCYIHLLPPSQRRRMVINKAEEEKKKTKPVPEDHSQPSAGKMKKSKTAPSMAQKYPPHHKQYPIAKKLTKEISALKSEVVRMKLITAIKPPLPSTYAVSNPPPLPPTYVPTWPPINDRLEMPDE